MRPSFRTASAMMSFCSCDNPLPIFILATLFFLLALPRGQTYRHLNRGRQDLVILLCDVGIHFLKLGYTPLFSSRRDSGERRDRMLGYTPTSVSQCYPRITV